MEYGMGVLLALLVCAAASWAGFDKERGLYPIMLMVIATYYILFAAMAGTTGTLARESLPAALFIFLAVLGFKKTPWIVVAALAAHGIFDSVHASLIENPGVPLWWPGFCLTFDVVAAAFLAALLLMRVGAADGKGLS